MKTSSIFEYNPPVVSIVKINETFQTKAKKIFLPKNYILRPINKRNIYIVNGPVDIIQKEPYHTIGTMYERLPLGLVEMHYPLKNIFYKIREDSSTHVISIDEWLNTINNENLENDVLEILCYMIYVLLMKINDVFTEKSENMVNNLIYRYSALSEVIKIEESLFSYIHNRTSLSKSLIMKILSNYKADEYITMVKGRLISINKPLKDKEK